MPHGKKGKPAKKKVVSKKSKRMTPMDKKEAGQQAEKMANDSLVYKKSGKTNKRRKVKK